MTPAGAACPGARSRERAIAASLTAALLACAAGSDPQGGAPDSGSSPAAAPIGAEAAPEASALDRALETEIRIQWGADPHVDGSLFGVSVRGGRATLSGSPTTMREWDRAVAVARLVPGVLDVSGLPDASPEQAAAGSGIELESWDPPARIDPAVAWGLAVGLGSRRDAEPVLPPPEGSDGSGAVPGEIAAASGDRPRTYRVGSGESLSIIARRTMGDGNAWRRIYELNREIIGPDPQRVSEGMELRIPQD